MPLLCGYVKFVYSKLSALLNKMIFPLQALAMVQRLRQSGDQSVEHRLMGPELSFPGSLGVMCKADLGREQSVSKQLPSLTQGDTSPFSLLHPIPSVFPTYLPSLP